jgi:hypothetical protein
MPISTFNLEWLNHNSQRSYPLAAHATKRDTTDSISIPDSFIVELDFPIHAATNVRTGYFFLYTLTVASTGYNITIGYDNGTATPDLVAAVNIAKATHVENAVYQLQGLGNYEDSVGSIVIGKLDEINAEASGRYVFTRAGAVLDAGVIRPSLRAVTSLVIQNGGDESSPITGIAKLTAGNNMRLTTSVTGSTTTIRIDGVDGENFNEDCVCSEDANLTPITTINGIPGNDGDFTFVPKTCISITPLDHGLNVSNTCSAPCCGCRELDPIKTDLRIIRDMVTILQGAVTRQEAELRVLTTTVMASRLCDFNCEDADPGSSV